MRRVAVIGSGISGLSVAHGLRDVATVTLFEADIYFGGHTHTVDVTVNTVVDGKAVPVTHGVDTGFLVFNERTYPELIRLFGELDVAIASSEMSFSVQVPDTGLEWSGCNLNTVFAQRSNLVKPGFWRMSFNMRQKPGLTRLLRCANTVFRSQPLHSKPVSGTCTENDISDGAVATSNSPNKRISSG